MNLNKKGLSLHIKKTCRYYDWGGIIYAGVVGTTIIKRRSGTSQSLLLSLMSVKSIGTER